MAISIRITDAPRQVEGAHSIELEAAHSWSGEVCQMRLRLRRDNLGVLGVVQVVCKASNVGNGTHVVPRCPASQAADVPDVLLRKLCARIESHEAVHWRVLAAGALFHEQGLGEILLQGGGDHACLIVVLPAPRSAGSMMVRGKDEAQKNIVGTAVALALSRRKLKGGAYEPGQDLYRAESFGSVGKLSCRKSLAIVVLDAGGHVKQMLNFHIPDRAAKVVLQVRAVQLQKDGIDVQTDGIRQLHQALLHQL
mmetsp:Transcript_103225/g.245854  ORF Transcript_103225/g.245854 Transcript_103225/m.245854 type:complete len:252 (+) Transcript_103225:370-1125(+)